MLLATYSKDLLKIRFNSETNYKKRLTNINKCDIIYKETNYKNRRNTDDSIRR